MWQLVGKKSPFLGKFGSAHPVGWVFFFSSSLFTLFSQLKCNKWSLKSHRPIDVCLSGFLVEASKQTDPLETTFPPPPLPTPYEIP